MKKMIRSTGFIAAALLVSGCQNAEETEETNAETAEKSAAEEQDLNENEKVEQENDSEENSSENTGAGSSNEENNEEKSSGNAGEVSSNAENDSNENSGEESGNASNNDNSDTYTEIKEASAYSIDTKTIEEEVDGILQFYTAISFMRAEEEQPLEERIEQSLIDGDPSEQEILRSYVDISTDWPALNLQFQEEGNQLSATSAQSVLFYASLFTISDLYGIEEISFLNPDEELDIIVAERGIQEPVNLQEERGLTRGYYTIYDEELEETLFLAGGDIEEQVPNETEEPLTFPETMETMAVVEGEDTFYSSAMVEGIEVTQVSMEDGEAAVQYTMDEEITSEADRIVFEKAIQLAALDFQAEEVNLINDTAEERTVYPLIEQ